MSSPMVGRSRWTTAALSLVTFLCLAGVAALMVWGTSAIMPDGRQPASSGVKAAVPAAVPAAATAVVVEAAAAASAEPVLAPPDESGPYHAGWYTTEYEVKPYGVYRASIYYPARSEARFAAADASGAPYPGIVAANGYYGADWNITWLPRQLASHGYVALCFTPPAGGTLNTWTYSGLVQSWDTTQWAAGFKAGIDKLKEENTLPGSLVYGLLDADTFGAIGLSMGGGGALEAAGSSAEIDAVVGLAPAYSDVEGIDGICHLLAQNGSSFADDIPDWLCWLLDAADALGRLDRVFADVRTAAADIAVPAQVQVGSGDAFILPDWVHAAYDDIPGTSGKAYVEINGGSHAGFIDAWVLSFGDSLEQALGGGIEIEVQEQHRVSQKYFISWFNYYLKGQAGYGAYLFGAEAQADVNSGVLSALETSVPG
jgi:dienelactone hydrolase